MATMSPDSIPIPTPTISKTTVPARSNSLTGLTALASTLHHLLPSRLNSSLKKKPKRKDARGLRIYVKDSSRSRLTIRSPLLCDRYWHGTLRFPRSSSCYRASSIRISMNGVWPGAISLMHCIFQPSWHLNRWRLTSITI